MEDPNVVEANRLAELQALANEVRDNLGDPERAHNAEDRLRKQALEVIRLGEADPVKVVRIALSTENLQFPRWQA